MSKNLSFTEFLEKKFPLYKVQDYSNIKLPVAEMIKLVEEWRDEIAFIKSISQ